MRCIPNRNSSCSLTRSHTVLDSHRAITKLVASIENCEVQLDCRSRQNLLSLAAEYGHTVIAKLSFNTGKVDIDSKGGGKYYGDTALSRAAADRYEDIVMLLLNTSNVNADLRDRYGRTPLSRDAENGNIGIVKLLQHTGTMSTS
jgi:ankyrin repeat protein